MTGETGTPSFPEAAQRIEAMMTERYSTRLAKEGVGPLALGWDSTTTQRARFQAVMDLVDLEGLEVADIGCGFSDFYAYVLERGVRPLAYLGVDINEDLLAISAERFPEAQHEQRNILTTPYDHEIVDVAVMNGVLNLRLHDVDNYVYSNRMIENAFAMVRKALVVDFLSEHRTPEYPYADFVFYHKPERRIGVAAELTNDFALKHDYAPIPQKEFMLVLRK